MPSRSLEEAYRQALATRTRTRTELAVACVPFLVDSTFRAQKTPSPREKAVARDAEGKEGTGRRARE
jgi:hypothetical protein